MPGQKSYTLFLNTRDAIQSTSQLSYTFPGINWDVVFNGGECRNPNQKWTVTHSMVSQMLSNTLTANIRTGLVKCDGLHNMSTSMYVSSTGAMRSNFINTFRVDGPYTYNTNISSQFYSLPSNFTIGQPTGTGSLTLTLCGDTSTVYTTTTPMLTPVTNLLQPFHCIHTFVFTLIE